MPITLGRAARHVQEQVERLAARGGRSVWPSFLYHACDVTTALNIVRQGQLKCRNEAENFLDVANEGALNIYEGSHSKARLYFRPKNMFHLRTEGIKCINDPYRLPNHMSIPVMFVFDFVSVITLPGACFSDGNVQKSRIFLDGDEEFDTLDFDAIYHDAPPKANGDYIRNMRMSEVAVDGQVDLEPHLKAIVFRTQTDMQTFEYLLGLHRVACPYKRFVERSRGTLFFARSFYINELNFQGGTINLTFNFPSDYTPHEQMYKVYIRQRVGLREKIFDKTLQLNHPTLRVVNFEDAPANWHIKLEDQLAFRGLIKSQASELF